MSLRAPEKTGKRRNMYCGPFAYAVVTGLPYDVAYERLRRILQKSRITGMFNSELHRALSVSGYEVVGESGNGRTLARWLRDREDRRGLYIVNVTGHYIVVQGNKIVDTLTRRPVFLSQYPHRRKRVKEAWKIGPKDP